MKLLHNTQSSRYFSSNQQNFYMVAHKSNFGTVKENLPYFLTTSSNGTHSAIHIIIQLQGIVRKDKANNIFIYLFILYLLHIAAIGLAPGGSSTSSTYTSAVPIILDNDIKR